MPDRDEPRRRTVAAIQSSYIPWKGYFDIVRDADLFIFYDDVQYTKNDWRNRNRIKTNQGSAWITIPVRADLGQTIREVRPTGSQWAQKHWKTLCQYYSRAPHFARYREFFESIYLGSRWDSLSRLNQHLITSISRDLLGITTQFADSSDYPASGRRLERLIEVLRRADAGVYVSGPSARDYIDAAAFRAAGIDLVYKSYDGYPEYPQFHPPFEHNVSILDLLFHAGPEAPYYIWGWRKSERRAAPS
jgi:hypothetical protein